MTRTRLAITQAISEGSLLDSCAAGWSELGRTAVGG